MSQHIGVERMNERAEMLDRAEINAAALVDTVWEISDCKSLYPFLATIDPYGDTYINGPQKETFTKELRAFSENSSNSAVVDIADTLIRYIENTGIHQYIRLIGD